MTFSIVFIVILLLIIPGGIWLQIFLSKKESKYLGLILPSITFTYSLIMVLSVALFAGMTAWDIFVLVASTFLISNIPTIVLLAIYFACREKNKRNNELDKMNIQDLE